MLNPEWYEAADKRMSRRRFIGEPIPTELAEKLRIFCDEFRPLGAARTIFVEHAPAEVFTGLVGSYGRIEGAPSVALFVGPKGSDVDIGYVGEAFILEATRLGLDTCWLAGAFSRKRAASMAGLALGEHVPAVTAVGMAETAHSTTERAMRSFVRASKRAPLDKIAPGAGSDGWPDWARSAVEAARKAPSGGNNQPWRFRFENGALVLSRSKKPYWTVELDLGIAMLHAELGAEHVGVEGVWEKLPGPDVARFVPT